MTTTAHQSEFRSVQLRRDVEGRLFLYSLPGRYESWNVVTGQFQRHAITHIVSLMPEREVNEKSTAYAKAVSANTLPGTRTVFPIRDYDVPQDLEGFYALAEATAKRIRTGERVLVHCAAGQGRTGMFAICVLIALGYGRTEAARAVARAGSRPENRAQKKVVAGMARREGTLHLVLSAVRNRLR